MYVIVLQMWKKPSNNQISIFGLVNVYSFNNIVISVY